MGFTNTFYAYNMRLRIVEFQQHPPELPPLWFPDGIFGFAGECCGPIFIPLAYKLKRAL